MAQGLVAKDAALKDKTADGRGTVDLDNLTYTAINGAAKTYLFRNHACLDCFLGDIILDGFLLGL